MAISTNFNTEFQLVATPGHALTFETGYAGHTRFQFSYFWNGSGYTIRGGSDLACEQGAADLLDSLGYRFLGPGENYTKRPVSIATDKSATLQSYAVPLANLQPSPFYTWTGTYLSSRAPYQAADTKFRILNGVARSLSTGHRWGSIIAASNLASFWALPENAALLYTNGGGNRSINLINMTRGSADWTRMVNICAQWLLRDASWFTGLLDYECHDFDAPDGDDNPSDKVFPFASDVAMACRNGVAAIGPYSQIDSGTTPATRPNALLGVYSYANHKTAPSMVCPGVFVAVALAYNDSGYTAAELLAAFKTKVDMVGIREYYDVADWSGLKPMGNSRTRTTGLDYYNDLLASGFQFANGQSTVNHFYNIIMNRRLVKTYRNGTLYPYASAVTDVVDAIFNGDSAVTDLYNFWGNPKNTHNRWSLLTTFTYINNMQSGWYKTAFQKLAVALYDLMFLPPQMVSGVDADWNTANDPFPAAFSRVASTFIGIRDDWIVDSYEFIGDYTDNGGAAYWRPNYPALKLTANPVPNWYYNPVVPTTQEFTDRLAILQTISTRPTVLDSADVSVVHNITPVVNGTTATGIESDSGGIAYTVIGPAVVKVTRASTLGPPDPDTGIQPPISGAVTYPDYSEARIYEEYLPYEAKVEVESGLLFQDWIVPTRRKQTTTVGNENYLYIPTRVAGEVNLYTIGTFRVIDETGTHNIVNERYASHDANEMNNLGPGQVKINVPNTANVCAVYIANRYISLDPTKALLPTELAEEEFPVRITVTKP